MSDETFGAPGYTYTIIAVSLLCKSSALRSFSLDKLHYWRESGSGISSPAYFLSKDTIDHFNTVIKPVVYLSMFYFFSNLRSSFSDNYIVLFCLVYCVTGIAYVLAIFLEPGPSQLCSVILPVVFTLIANQSRDSEFLKNLADLCYTKWALEAFVTANAERGMFRDYILRTVTFEGLGITVPERVNPPDYYIDILEGIVKPTKSLGASYEELPLRWMLHNGCPVPPDMLQNSSGLAPSPLDTNLGCRINPEDAEMAEQSITGEIWEDLQCNVERQHGIKGHCFLRSKDLSNRRTPGFLLQYKYFLGRVGKQRLREAKIQAIDYLILLLAGACLGLLTKMSDETFGAPGYTYTSIAVSLLCKISALRSLPLDRLLYWRETSSGISSPAYFLSKDTIDHFNTVIKPVVYLSMFYFFSNLRSSFTDNYIILFCLVYCVTGIVYALAIFLEPGPSQLCSVILPVVFTLIANQSRDSKFLKNLADLCYTKWALEAFITANAERYDGVW